MLNISVADEEIARDSPSVLRLKAVQMMLIRRLFKQINTYKNRRTLLILQTKNLEISGLRHNEEVFNRSVPFSAEMQSRIAMHDQ